MNGSFFRFILVPLIIVIVSVFARFIRSKLAKPAYDGNVQKTGKFDGCILKFFYGLTIFTGMFALFGLLLSESEMAIAFFVLTVIFIGIIFLLKREYNLSYEENSEYFVLNHKNKKYKVYYENIVDWRPSFNEIRILDKTREDQKYIRVNIAMVKPEILLRKIADMTFEGRFPRQDDLDPSDPMREQEIVSFLNGYNYGYLIEDLESDF